MIRKLVAWVTSLFGFSKLAVKMFGLANDISGLNKDTLPTELLSLNAVQLSRGLLNYTVFQSKLDWVLPYWVVKQYNPQSLSFIPRSHLGLSMNVTERNWTAVGNTECNVEPIVDPRGLVTPFRDGWSIDVWLKVGDKILLPSTEEKAFQSLQNDLPIVITNFEFEGGSLNLGTYTVNSALFITAFAELKKEEGYSIIFSIRPFNPEGISPVNNISFDSISNTFLINNKDKLIFNGKPDFVYCSNYNEDDSFNFLEKKSVKTSSNCNFGLANAIAVFNLNENRINISCRINLELNNSGDKFFPDDGSIKYWDSILKYSTKIITPDKKLNSLVKASTTSLLMFIDRDTITPGPFTYHQFWIRDAVFMLEALDKLGYSNLTSDVIKSFPKFQDKGGFFRSQKGEWDSNGQVLWYVYRHSMISGDLDSLKNIYGSLLKGALWIDKFRLKDKKYSNESFYGLFPAGLSAEHLGLVDYYFWDNFWALAGLYSFKNIQTMLLKNESIPNISDLINKFSLDLESAIKIVQTKFCIDSIPASTTRGIDCGMIGSLSAVYPTQLYSPNDSRIISTLETIISKYFYKGMFFQNFIHSGMNTYLTIQTAHAFLYCGNRKKFWEILNNVVSFASPTLNYPEAIHPWTGGGVMGDGHHGWTSAEIISAVRDAFIYERFTDSSDFVELVLFAGIPIEWFEGREPFSISNAPVVGGRISISVIPEDCYVKINIDYTNNTNIETKLKMILPCNYKAISMDGNLVYNCYKKEIPVEVPDSAKEIVLY